MIDLQIEEKYFTANLLNKTLDLHFYGPQHISKAINARV